MEKEVSGLGIKDMTESERPRERLLKYGAQGLSNAELLAIIISSGTQKDSALELAYRLLSSEKGVISSFSNYMPQEYCRIKGIGKATACKLAAAVEFGKRVYSTPKEKFLLDTPDALAKHFSDMRNFHKEVLRIAMFNSKLEIIKTVDVSMGGLAHTSAVAREVFADAIRTGANAIVLAHNHPSGDPSPSEGDIRTTEILISAGKIIGIDVMDHLIIGDGTYCSFKESGLIKKAEKL